MKISKIFKNPVLFIVFLMPIYLFSQNGIVKDDELSIQSEKLELIFPNRGFLTIPITLFNKTTTKVKVGNYGDAKIIKRSGSESSTKILGISYVERKSNLSIDFYNSLNEISKLIGTKRNSNILGIIEATITTNQKESKTWTLYLRLDNTLFLNRDKESKLTAGERTIKIISTNFCRFENSNEISTTRPETVFYEFIENGVLLGVVTFDGENSIWLKPDLDSKTKLILSTAMLSIAN
jgi:hypothetical protein